jgi:hypothetical protein
MQTAKQVSVSLVNKPGRLAAMLDALNKEKVDLQALVVMDSGDRGTIRFVPDDLATAIQVLDDMNAKHDVGEVLLIEVPSQLGAFRKICQRLAAEHLNIDYAYCTFSGVGGARKGPLAVIRVNDLAKAQRVLSENGTTTRRRQPQATRRPVYAR